MKRSIVYIMLGSMLFSSNLLVSNVQAVEKTVISFLSDDRGDFDIFIIDIEGTVLERITTDAMNKSSLTWSPNDNLFGYSSNENKNLDIYKMDIRDRVPIRLTQHPNRDLWPAWSPNGEWIAFVSNRAGTHDIYRIDNDGSNLTRLTVQGQNNIPAWSPDSQLIAFDSNREENHSIYIMDANGGKLRQVTEDLPLWPGCTWSPDGKQIAFVSGALGEEGVNIFTIDIDGNNSQKITDLDNGFRSGYPAWSPDGKWIAYSVVEVDEWPNPANEFKLIFSDSTIYIIDSEGNDDGLPLEETSGLSSDHTPVWVSRDFFAISPDSNKHTLTWGKLKQP